MQLLKFKIIYGLLWCISILPWPIFYALSDFVFFVIYRVVKYRKRVVTANLKLAFPEKSYEEIKSIRKAFYRHMCDMFLEMIKSITISPEETQQRFVFKNLEALRKLEAENKSIILLAAHYANYEWGNSIQLTTTHDVVGVFKPIKNEHFNNFAKKIRARFGADVIPSKKVMRYVIQRERNKNNPTLYGLVGDQSPNASKTDFKIPFMNHDVPVFVGGEVLAKKMDMAICYLKVDKVKRGFYEAEVVLVQNDLSNNTNNFEAIRSYYQMLEAQIRDKPEFYLWTHKRWKHADTKASKVI